MDWLLADAKNRFSELVTKALNQGPQRVRRRGDAVIIVAEKDFRRLTGTQRTFKDFLLNGPDLSALDLARDNTPMRDIDL
jgi:prevent-host-death family protein